MAGLGLGQIFGFLGECEKSALNIPYALSQQAINLTVGRGLIFDSPNTKVVDYLNKFYEKQQVRKKLADMVGYMSLIGATVPYLVPVKDADAEGGIGLSLRVSKWQFSNRVAMVDEEEQVAEIWDQPNTGDTANWQKITITPTTITVQTFGEKKVGVNTEYAEPSKDLEPITTPVTFEHNLGGFPVVFIQNRDFPRLFGNSTFMYFPDYMNSFNLIRQLHKDFRIWNEAIVAVKPTKLFDVPNDEMNPMAQSYSAIEEMANSNILVNARLNPYSTSQGGIFADVLEGNPATVGEFRNNFFSRLEAVFNSAGYSSPFRTEDNESQRNELSIVIGSKLDLETTRAKQSILKEKLYKLFDLVIKFAGLWPDGEKNRPYEMRFVPAGTVDTLQNDLHIKEGLELGLISRLKAISQYQQLPMHLAQEEMANIDKETEANLERENKFNGKDEGMKATDNSAKDFKDEVTG